MNEFELFQSALDIEDAAARRAFLESACNGDAKLLSRIESLLASHDGESQFLNTPVAEQIEQAPEPGSVATILAEANATLPDESNSTHDFLPGATPPTEPTDDTNDEYSLGYLEPATKPGTLGRLAHYEVLDVIGRGAFGTVLRAFDEKLHRVVAIKVMAPELASTSPARKRFIREAQASAAIRHEHVVSVYAVEETPLPYLVMEYIPGKTLQQRLDEQGPLDVPTVLRLGRQIAEGLAAAHAINLIHRDIKPGNILLETGVQDRVKITDFGLARAADDASLTQSGTIAGTPMYMAPEQALGQKLDQRADLFSFGSVLYQMVSGRPPFRAASTLAVLKRVTEDTPRPIREIIPETPHWLGDIIAKLHAKQPAERYQSARDVADVLANCEAQLKEHLRLKDLSHIPRARTAPATMWKRGAAAALIVSLLAYGLYAFTRPGTEPSLAGSGTIDPIQAGVDVAPDKTTEAGLPLSDGWVQLFNGKDLTGWKNDDNHWTIENGMLVTRLPKGAVKKSGFLQTIRKDYRDFHVRAEAKINAGGDSGLFFRFGEQGDVSLQAQITTDPGSGGSLLRHAATIVPGSQWIHGDKWFSLEIIAQGPQVAVFVDGQEAATWIDPTGGTQAGPIAFESGFPGTEFFVRKVEIKSPTTASPVDFNGTWESDWGDVTFTQDLASSESSPMLGGTYKDGHIAGSIQLQTRVFTGTFREKAGQTGRIRLTLSPDGKSISGRYYQEANPDKAVVWKPASASKVWNMTRRNAVPQGQPQPSDKDEWVQLFNGKNLTGWKFHPRQIGDWEVRDGILRGTARHSHLYSERGDYENFHLRAEVKLNLGGDSGIVFRAPFELRRGKTANEAAIPGCYEAEMHHYRSNARATGSISETTAEAPPKVLGRVTDRSLTKPDEWFTIEVIAENNHFISKIDGIEVANCKDPLGRHKTGHLALQVWHPNTLVQFRKIEIRELPASAPAESAPPLAVAPFDAVQARTHQDVWAKHLGVPVEYTNSLGMKFVLIPPGTFRMGSTSEEIAWLLAEAPEIKGEQPGSWVYDKIRGEGPERLVTIPQPFYLGVHEVRLADFRVFAGATNYQTVAEKTGGGLGWDFAASKFVPHPDHIWSHAKHAASEHHPVVFVTPADAQAFSRWLSEKEQQQYSLPQEEQWEFACRAGTTTRWSFGDDPAVMDQFGWVMPHSKGRTQPVSQLSANPFGLHDLHGNVSEITLTPQGQEIERGGAFGRGSYFARSAERSSVASDEAWYARGFRLALTVQSVKQSPLAETADGVPQVLQEIPSTDWIDVLPLIDPRLDKWDIRGRTGKNAWQFENAELAVLADPLGSKLVLPLDSDWPAFDFEIEFTRRLGNNGLNINLPTSIGECPLVVDPPGPGGVYLGAKDKGPRLKDGAQIKTGTRTTLRVEVRRKEGVDVITVAVNGETIGEWTGDRSTIGYTYREGFPHDRRLSLWIQSGGNEFVFHRIRVRRQDGTVVRGLCPAPAAPLPAAAPNG